MEAKQTVRELLDRLPDDCRIEDVLYHLYVVSEIERGLADADADRTIPHEEVEAQLRIPADLSGGRGASCRDSSGA